MNLKQACEDWIGADEPEAKRTGAPEGKWTVGDERRVTRNVLRAELRASLPSLLAKIEQLIPEKKPANRDDYNEELKRKGYNEAINDVRDALLNTKVEIVERFEKGKPTTYSLDGGETYLTKEQLSSHSQGLNTKEQEAYKMAADKLDKTTEVVRKTTEELFPEPPLPQGADNE